MKKLTLSGWVLAAACLTLGANTAFANADNMNGSAQKSQAGQSMGKDDMMQRMEKRIEKLKSELSLSDEQTQKIRDIMTDMREDMHELHEKMEAMHDEMKDDIKSVLNDEQKAKYDKMCEKQKAKRDKKMKEMDHDD